jgi:predicted nuclease with TOPRIM domain
MFRKGSVSFVSQAETKQFNSKTLFNIVTENIDNLRETLNRDNVNNIIDDKSNLNALQYAVKQGNKDIINLLLSLNANIQVKTANGEDLIDFSLKYHNRNIIDFMYKSKDDKIIFLTMENNQLKDDIHNKDNKITYLNKSLDQNYTKIQSMSKDNNDNERKITELKRSNDNISIELNNTKLDNLSLKRKFDNIKSENDSIIQVNNNISTERNTLRARCTLLEKENKELVIVNNELKEKNSSLTDRYTKLDQSYNVMLNRNRKA